MRYNINDTKMYINKKTQEQYQEGESITITLDDGSVFSGIPTVAQLEAWGYEEWTPEPAPEPTEEELERQNLQDRLIQIEEELKSMDYLTSKYIDGEDMTQYGDWQSTRRQLRQEHREIEEQLNNL